MTAEYRIISWEPIAQSGERINVAFVGKINDHIFGERLIDSDILISIYGSKASGIASLIDFSVDSTIASAKETGLHSSARCLHGHFFISRLFRISSNSPLSLKESIAFLHCSLRNKNLNFF